MNRICGLLLWLVWLLSLPAFGDEATVARWRAQVAAAGGVPAPAAQWPIWQTLQQLDSASLLALSRDGGHNYFEQGWLELALADRLAPGAERNAQLLAWQRQWFHHPARAWLDQLQRQARLLPVPAVVERLALLLPLSGAFADQGRQVLAGVRAALDGDRRQGHATPELQVFDSAEVADLPAFVQRLARQPEPPDLLVGPLQAALTAQLVDAQPLPVLALNRVGGSGFNGVQLDLASDQELEQLLARLREDGRQRVLLLAPAAADWVEPLLARIEIASAAAGVSVLAQLRFGADVEVLQRQLADRLGVSASRQRGDRLAARLGLSLQQQPRRRQDIEAVLMVALPEQARLLKPMLDYYRAGDLPVYASSHLFSGQADPLRDRDLEGVVFCDMPWRLRQRPGRAPSSRFFALGMDAGSLYRALPALQSGRPGHFEGETGDLRLLQAPRLQRQLRCARFVRGVPVLLD